MSSLFQFRRDVVLEERTFLFEGIFVKISPLLSIRGITVDLNEKPRISSGALLVSKGDESECILQDCTRIQGLMAPKQGTKSV